jgi:hypothetical protein
MAQPWKICPIYNLNLKHLDSIMPDITQTSRTSGKIRPQYRIMKKIWSRVCIYFTYQTTTIGFQPYSPRRLQTICPDRRSYDLYRMLPVTYHTHDGNHNHKSNQNRNKNQKREQGHTQKSNHNQSRHIHREPLLSLSILYPSCHRGQSLKIDNRDLDLCSRIAGSAVIVMATAV